MRKICLMLCAAAPLLLARPAHAQPGDDRERAAEAAEAAAQAAETAARAARASADALRRQMGEPAAAPAADVPSPDENAQELIPELVPGRVDTRRVDEARR